MTSRCHFYLPPILVILILASSYHIYVLSFCVYVISDLLTSLLYLFFFNVVFLMFVWSFLSTIFTPVGTVPLEYQLADQEIENYLREDELRRDLLLKNIQAKKNLVIQMRDRYGHIRFCNVCRVIKPDRCHHCSTCGVCVLKMDHHCGWINNCVGFSNHKNFFLMLFYCSAYCIYFTSTTLEYFIIYVNTHEKRYLPVVVGFLTATFLGLLGGIFFLYNCGLLFRNETTLEKIQRVIFTQEDASFNLGCCKNFMEVFGRNWRLWLFPVFSAIGNGTVFPVVVKRT